MPATLDPARYALSLSAAERDHLLVALELAIAVSRDDPDRGVLLADVDAVALDHLADRLVPR